MNSEFDLQDWLSPPPPVSRITDGLYMGAFPNGQEVQYDIVVNCSEEPHQFGRMRIHYPFVDGEVIPNTNTMFPLARFIHGYAKDHSVLVHCRAGINRSGMICVLVLMCGGDSAERAIARVRRARSDHVLCNRHFEQFLLNLRTLEGA